MSTTTPTRLSQEFISVARGRLLLNDTAALMESKSFVGVMGPPGAGKSTLCTALVNAAFGTHLSAFEAANSLETFTRGIWMLSLEYRRSLETTSDWEPLDVEGFQSDDEGCYRLTMVMALLSEVVVFCNRNPRYDDLFKAARTLASGLKLCERFSLKSPIKMVFVQLRPGEETEIIQKLLEKVKSLLPEGIQVQVFFLPELRGVSTNAAFSPEFIAATRTLVSMFKFGPLIAAAAKKTMLEEMIRNVNSNSENECKETAKKFFRQDCDRIMMTVKAQETLLHTKRAVDLHVCSGDTTLAQYVGNPVFPTSYHFEESPYYSNGASSIANDLDAECIPPLQLELQEIYKKHFTLKMNTLKVEQEEERKRQEEERKRQAEEQKRQEEARSVMEAERIKRNAAVEEARLNSLKAQLEAKIEEAITAGKRRALAELSAADVHRPLWDRVRLSAWDDLIKNEKLQAEALARTHVRLANPGSRWHSFRDWYEGQKDVIRVRWDTQIQNAKWHAPVMAFGDMHCNNGHSLNTAVSCGTCNGGIYWVDGPHCVIACQTCGRPWMTDLTTVCGKCGAGAKCRIRESTYLP
ncbi:hypothetical protein Pelo_12773 [Pelomyxa schiedti]|nr:hypothetical protein Pelo_12773 [Pelomyxa schiedti]